MIYLGIDDTDTLEHPGTNQLARKIVATLAGRFTGHLILRHQLLEDPRVPCTMKNGCASILLEHHSAPGESPGSDAERIAKIVDIVRPLMIDWCPVGSDPGLCVTARVPAEVITFGRRCQSDLIRQVEARELAAAHGIFLEGLGGTQDGVIGALAAVGLAATLNDGRVIYHGASETDLFDVSGTYSIEELQRRGVEEVRLYDSSTVIQAGSVDIGKRLRPNLREGKVVLFVTPYDQATEGMPRDLHRGTHPHYVGTAGNQHTTGHQSQVSAEFSPGTQSGADGRGSPEGSPGIAQHPADWQAVRVT